MKKFFEDDKFIIRNIETADFQGIQETCSEVYPFISPWRSDQLNSQLSVFPEGQIVVLDKTKNIVVGLALSLIVRWDDYDIKDSWKDFTDKGYFTNHDPEEGRTLYGAEIMIRPDCQGKGLGKKLYAARRAIAQDLNLLRIRAGARLRGYSLYAKELSPEHYVLKVIRKEIFDPTVSFQLKQGFKIIDIVPQYLQNDPESLGYAVVIEWLNPDESTASHVHDQEMFFKKLENQTKSKNNS
ncbi:MAG: GNAT family N-acetyltransferase [Bdellovibrionales bacterium]|nr:GNAT family N-acetyltransferase [Bdellovibrionales bacterium]